MGAATEAKLAGLKGLSHMSELTGIKADTLAKRFKNNPKLFQADLDRAVERNKQSEEDK